MRAPKRVVCALVGRLGAARRRIAWLATVGWTECRVSCGKGICIAAEVRIQGLGSLVIADAVQLGSHMVNGQGQPIVLQPRNADASIAIGAGAAVMNGCCFIACTRIEIGAETVIGAETLIIDSDFHGLAPAQRRTPGKSGPVIIGRNAFIGTRVTILKGVTIGDDAVVAAGSIVVKDVAPRSIVGGNPARCIGSVDG